MNRTALRQLTEYGQSPWLEALSRGLLSSGQLERLVRERGIRGVTSSSSALREAIGAGGHYDAQIQALATDGEHSPETILRALAVTDVKHACDLMRPWRTCCTAETTSALRSARPSIGRARDGPRFSSCAERRASASRRCSMTPAGGRRAWPS